MLTGFNLCHRKATFQKSINVIPSEILIIIRDKNKTITKCLAIIHLKEVISNAIQNQRQGIFLIRVIFA